jgi:hypothetical protein
MPADGIIVGNELDALAVMAVVIPVNQHRAEAGHQAIDYSARSLDIVIVFLRNLASQRGATGSHDIHRVRACRQLFEHSFNRIGKVAHRFQPCLVSIQFVLGRQFFMYDQVGDFLEFAGFRDIENIVTAVMQIIAGSTDGADCGVAGRGAGQRN